MYRDAMPPSLRKAMKDLEDQAEFFNLQIERYKSIESNFFNFSFYEGSRGTCVSFEPLNTKGIANKIQIVHEGVAEPVAAKARTWKKFQLERTHNDLAKFDSCEDQDFLDVMACINQCLEVGNYQNALKRHSLFFSYKGMSSLPESPSILY